MTTDFSAEDVLLAARCALGKTDSAGIVYLHDAEGAIFAALVRRQSEAWVVLHGNIEWSEEMMMNHSHIEPGMWERGGFSDQESENLTLIRTIEHLLEAIDGIHVYPEGSIGFEELAEAEKLARDVLAKLPE